MSMIYLPSCKFTSYSPKGSKQIKSYLLVEKLSQPTRLNI